MEEMHSLADEVALQRDLLTNEDGSYLPQVLVDKQVELAQRPALELAQELAHVLLALALKKPGSTPKGVLSTLSRDYKITDESWREKVGPELRRVLAARGVDLPEAA